jgi:hypothetical protein
MLRVFGLVFVLVVGVAVGLTPPLDPYHKVGTYQERFYPGNETLRQYADVSAGVVSNAVGIEKQVVDDPRLFNFLGIVFGQLMDHDVALTGGDDGSSWPIPVPNDDPVFSSVGITELPFTRKGRHPTNLITPHVDGSLVYGSTQQVLDLLRQQGTPFLRTDENRLPPPVGNSGGPTAGSPASNMFLCGDERCSEQVFLTVLHTLWIREHNHQARRLMQMGYSEDPDELFEKARQIVIAEIQHITYGEWLTALIGSARNCDAWAQGQYAHDGDSQISVPFSAALYRLHSLIANQTAEELEQYGVKGLSSAFFRPSILRSADGNLAPFVRSMYTTLARRNDPMLVPDLRSFLFAGQPDVTPIGHDLLALNVQRGRDMGVPTYNHLRRALGLEPKATWQDITPDTKLQEALASVYASPEECDTWVCSAAEPLAVGSSMGETQTFVIRKQFCELHNTDMFYWDRADYLSDAEKDYVRGRTFSSILCDNAGVCDVSHDNAFLGTSAKSTSTTGTAALVGGAVAIGVILLFAVTGFGFV